MFSLKIVKGAENAEGVTVEMRLPDALTRFTVGRDPGNDWPIPDRTRAISARHCEFSAAGGGVLLRDLSTNGTFVNGAPRRMAGEHLLRDGDRIEFGPYTIVAQALRPLAPPPVVAAPAPPPVVAAPRPAPPPAARGGDPAAMLAAGTYVGAAPTGLTEFLRAAPPVQTEDVAVTRIRAAPKPTLETPPTLLPGALPVPPARPADPTRAVAQAAITVLSNLLQAQREAERQLGLASAAPALPDLDALLAPDVDAPALLRRVGEALQAHHRQLLARSGPPETPR